MSIDRDSDGTLDFTEHQLLVATCHSLRDKIHLVAEGDEIISQEEQALLDKLTEIIPTLKKF